MSKHVSIVIPAYNEEKQLPNLFAALKKQTYQNFEVVVVNNNSTDKTEEIAISFADKVIFEEKQGFSPARNRGFREASGKIIVKIDADTIPETYCLDKIVNVFKSGNDISAASGVTASASIDSLLGRFSYCLYFITMYFLRIIMGHHSLNGPIYALRADVAAIVRPHNEDWKYHEDMDMSCHASCYGKVVLIPGVLGVASYRRFANDPMHIFSYLLKGICTYFKHHPSHALHKVR